MIYVAITIAIAILVAHLVCSHFERKLEVRRRIESISRQGDN
jgi:hypothetical protein